MRTDIALYKIRKAREQGYQAGVKFAIENYSSVILLCLKDKFDFSTEQLQAAAYHINNTFDSVCQDYLSISDIANTLMEENDIQIVFGSGKDSQVSPLDRDILKEVISHSSDSKEDLEKQLKEAGYFVK